MKQQSLAKFFDKKRSAGQVSTESSKGAAATSSFGDVSKKRRTMTKNIVESDDENLDIENSGMDQAQSIVCEKENSPDLNDENGDYIKKHEIKQAKIGQPSTQGKLMETESSSTGDSTLKTAKQDDGTEREVSRAVLESIKSKSEVLNENKSWEIGQKTPFSVLSKTFESIEATTKRLEILDILTKFFINVIEKSPNDLIMAVYLCINKLGPTWEGLELGIGETVLMKAIASATGRPLKKIKDDLQAQGDLGKVAQMSRSNQPTMFKPKPLTVPSVYKTLKEIASISGHSAMNKKIDKIKFLLVSCRDNEARYLIRALEGKLRIGLAEQTVLVGLAHATVISKKSSEKKDQESFATDLADAAAKMKQVYNELPTYERIIPILLSEGMDNLEKKCKMVPGIPLKPMLAHPTKAITDVLDRFNGIKFTCEYKYDGERAQIHRLDSGKLEIYSRNQESMSAKYPDIVENMKMIPKEHVKSFVIDSEAVAWDSDKKKILPFQVLSTRKRKDVNTKDIVVKVCIFAFDLLYLNGESLLRKPLETRRKILYESFTEEEGKFMFAKHMEGQSVEEIQTFLDESVEGNCEGLMVKTVDKDSSYEPSKRSRNWLKVKKDYLEGVGDSLDLVVIGAYHGKGKRTGVYGGFLLACYEPESEQYQVISKIATGFSEEDLSIHTKFFKEKEIASPKSYYSYGEGVKPDVWFEPVQVWEVKAADLSISPVYTAARGLVDPNKGISLRFPRFIRIRDDKEPEDATNSDQVADMYRSQKINHGFNDDADVIEFY